MCFWEGTVTPILRVWETNKLETKTNGCCPGKELLPAWHRQEQRVKQEGACCLFLLRHLCLSSSPMGRAWKGRVGNKEIRFASSIPTSEQSTEGGWGMELRGSSLITGTLVLEKYWPHYLSGISSPSLLPLFFPPSNLDFFSLLYIEGWNQRW